jgi:hypothetical protein
VIRSPKLKVFESIVVADAVLVVNGFLIPQPTAEMPLHDETMLSSPLPLGPNGMAFFHDDIDVAVGPPEPGALFDRYVGLRVSVNTTPRVMSGAVATRVVLAITPLDAADSLHLDPDTDRLLRL